MKNRARYREAMEAAPVTAWTKMVQAATPTSPEATKSLHDLITLYDKPLLKLFQAVVGGNAATAEDWKQDFIVSHMMTGKVFQAAKPVGRFRTYLAVAVRNYVANRCDADRAQKRRTDAGAKPFSQMGAEGDEPFDAQVAGPGTADEFEETLTRARAWDLFNEAHCTLEKWCSSQQNPAELLNIAAQLRSGTDSLTSLRGASPIARTVVDKFREILRKGVREELLVRSGEDEESIAGREIGIFFDAHGRK